LADGNRASVGDVIITRSNDRRLRLTATDWVKNGDRWTITGVGRRGDLKVRHNRSHLTVQLPIDYVRASTGLGYATTIHSAQGITADSMHGLLTGQESRQQLYTMLTRGRHANHLYLQVVGDGDPHTVIRPDTISPRTPTETLQQIITRDEAPVSASALLHELNSPAARLFQAVQRYTDGLHVAAEQLLGPQTVAELDQANQYLRGLTAEPGWPTLRAHLLALAADTGDHPLRHMLTAASGRDLETAGDMAAVLYWRLPELTPTNPGRWPGSQAFHQCCMLIPCGGPTWPSDTTWSQTLPARFKTTLAKVTPSQSGLHLELTRTQPLSVRSRCGAPPTASVPGTREQPEEPNSKRSRPSGNNTSTGISPVPPIRQARRGLTNDKQHTLHLVAGTTTASARTKHPVNVRTGQPHPAANTTSSCCAGVWVARYSHGTQPTALSGSRAGSRRPPLSPT
jgi:hypothetical protein